MRPIKPDTGTRAVWEPPAFTKLAIGTETKSPGKTEKSGAEGPSGSAQHPAPPATPATKLGLSIEMAFPLSARFDG